MEAKYDVRFFILFTVLLQGMVLAYDDSLKSSSDLYIRRKRMDSSTSAPARSLPSHQLPPLLAYDLRGVSIIAPTKVAITRNGNITGSGYAIHPYLVLTRSVYIHPHHPFGVSTINRQGGGHTSQRVQDRHQDPTGTFVIIQLRDPIFLDDPVRDALPAAEYPAIASIWAYRWATQWIPEQLLYLRPLLTQGISELNFIHCHRVLVTSSDRPAPVNGYAVHPYIIVTRPEFVGPNASVISFMESVGETSSHRIQFRYANRDLNVEVLELLDPVLMRNGVKSALRVENYSTEAIVWAHNRAEEWKRTRLNQRNYFQENSV